MGFPKLGDLFGDPYNKDYSILGSILGSPYFGKLPNVGYLSDVGLYKARIIIAAHDDSLEATL